MNPLEDQQSLFALQAPLTQDFDIKIHKNGIILIFISNTCTIQKLKFDTQMQENLQGMTGKRKHGAATITEQMEFADVLINNEWSKIKTPVRAKLLEVNPQAETELKPGMLLCVYQPKWDQMNMVKGLIEKKQQNQELTEEEIKQWNNYVLVK
ncbi:Putative_glycine cleavage system H protein [Hexamita inflata]|uniref:Glycine cleavage system H protein n=1 Tax=Hexamita inflata TaxID=28002 RepID=A0AA86NPL6_9EUKA|nr:Putative glycine cleavage system H protein [Hexamita inflata]